MAHESLLRDQAGVISRAQALASGLTENDVRRLLRRRSWVSVHPGVYVNHTGELTWLQRAWAAVLFAWPAALCDESALRAADGPGKHRDEQIHVAVGRDRRICSPADEVLIHRMTHLDERTMWNLGPPRLRYEDAALDVAIGAASELNGVEVLAAAVGSRRTTALRMIERLETRERCPRRRWLAGVLRDVTDGTCSVLEHGFLTRVERAHGLPRAQRQVRVTATLGVIYRDARYAALELELDGRLFHSSTRDRDRDMDRDLDAAVDGRATVRLGYGQVFERPCTTALRIALLLRRGGWTGKPHACQPQCPLGGVWLSSGDSHTPPSVSRAHPRAG
jgi:hypothetical protein